MATLHFDADNGDDATGVGSVANPFKSMAKYTTTDVRSAGDIGIFRNNMTATYQLGSAADLPFDEDGTIANPIIMQRDYANAFSDDVDLSVTATATFTFGSKTVTYASDISGVLAVGDWIYAASDDAEEFSYEVAVVSTVTVTLFLPYKGAQAGSGKTTTNIGSPPIWGTTTGDFQWNFDADDYWRIQGIHIRGQDTNGQVEIDSATGHAFESCIFEGNNGGSRTGIRCTDDTAVVLLLRCRWFNDSAGSIVPITGAAAFRATIRDCLIDGNSIGGADGINFAEWCRADIEETEFRNNAAFDLAIAGTGVTSNDVLGRLRNCLLTSTTEIGAISARKFADILSEDHDGVIADTRQFGWLATADNTPILQSDTGTIRTGTPSIKVTPSTDLSTAWEHSRVKLFEYGIFATTASKKYEIFFRPTATADWTADPTAGELWIEVEFWGHASNNFRQIVKSTEVIDMNGSTTFTALSVTVAPAQAGVLYLRAYYAKTKESAKANTFFCDPVPVIT